MIKLLTLVFYTLLVSSISFIFYTLALSIPTTKPKPIGDLFSISEYIQTNNMPTCTGEEKRIFDLNVEDGFYPGPSTHENNKTYYMYDNLKGSYRVYVFVRIDTYIKGDLNKAKILEQISICYDEIRGIHHVLKLNDDYLNEEKKAFDKKLKGKDKKPMTDA